MNFLAGLFAGGGCFWNEPAGSLGRGASAVGNRHLRIGTTSPALLGTVSFHHIEEVLLQSGKFKCMY